jgi:hypothetical protein
MTVYPIDKDWGTHENGQQSSKQQRALNVSCGPGAHAAARCRGQPSVLPWCARSRHHPTANAWCAGVLGAPHARSALQGGMVAHATKHPRRHGSARVLHTQDRNRQQAGAQHTRRWRPSTTDGPRAQATDKLDACRSQALVAHRLEVRAALATRCTHTHTHTNPLAAAGQHCSHRCRPPACAHCRRPRARLYHWACEHTRAPLRLSGAQRGTESHKHTLCMPCCL